MIKFNDHNFLKLPRRKLKAWLEMIAFTEGSSIKNLQYNFVDVETMRTLNRTHLNHDTDTDVITFDYKEPNFVSAEAYISCSALLENASKYSQTAENETLRLLSHALLHCLGYGDKTDEDQAIMRKKEEYYIRLFHVKH
ncbi:MAG: rRNA maturation RNase YbeY [Flavobacteriaceae bacterium]|nr:rRNA maturation RNase YbeY [Flavobacteriaceae bacterium]